MNRSKYLYTSKNLLLHFEFISEGPNGRIKKMVEYTATSTKNVFNLRFGDYDEDTKSINDLSVTNNSDSLKVLSNVASTVYAFIKKYPNAWILAKGSTAVRTRLYRMGITNNLREIAEDFKVFGYTQNSSKAFQKYFPSSHYPFLWFGITKTCT